MRENITIGNCSFEADSKMIPLLNELYNVGLEVTQHCAGHKKEGDGSSYLSIKLRPDMEIGIRYDVEPRIIIRWNCSASNNSSYTKLQANHIVGCANINQEVVVDRKTIAEKIESLLEGQPYFDCLAILEAVKAEMIHQQFAQQEIEESPATVA